MLKDFTKESFDIIIQAGQSNSEGTGFGKATSPYVPNENVWYLNGDFTISKAVELVNGNDIQSNFSLAFANEYLNSGYLKGNRKLLIVRAAVGGTGFLDNRWGLADDLFLNMIDMIKTAVELNKENKIVAMLWHQGETDALLDASFETHYNNLFSLVNAVKQTFSCDELPFIAGNFVEQWRNENKAICEPVIKAMKEVCLNIGNGKFVSTDGLLSNSQTFDCDDTIHFSRESIYRLGERYFCAFKELI